MADTSAASTPPPPQKQLITVTTKSPDAQSAFMKAWDLADNGWTEEALDQCRKAVAADPDFAFGHSCIGNVTPGAAGQAELDKGLELAAKLPDAERLTIEALSAARHQNLEKYSADIKKVAELAPDDFHAQVQLGNMLFGARDFSGAATAYKRALELSPTASFVHGQLMWVHTQLREYDEALASARKYADAAPTEAGAHQALASAMVNMNQVKEAQAELSKAVNLAPKSRSAYYDLATVKALAGDFPGARDALEKSKTAEVLPTDAISRNTMTAWVLLDEGKQADAFKLLDSAEKDADAKHMPWPGEQATSRAWAFWALGKPADALKAADAGLARCDSEPESSEAYKEGCHRDLLVVKAFAQIQAKKPADAQKTVNLLREDAKKWPDNTWVQLDVDMLSDQVAALAKKDGKAATAVLTKCPPDNVFFKLSILRQAEKDGDKTGAEQARKDILGRPVKDIGYPFVARMAKK